MHMKDLQAVSFNGKLYVGGTAESHTLSARLYSYTPAVGLWEEINTPVYRFALATYHSQLLLISGRTFIGDDEAGPTTNIVYELFQSEFIQYSQLLTSRCDAFAVSFGDLLVVAGGEYSSNDIEVYDGSKWWSICHPCIPNQTTSLVHFDQHLYVKSGTTIFYTCWESLKKSNLSSANLDWKSLTTIPRELSLSGLTVFGDRLVITNGVTLVAYSTCTKKWIHVSDSTEGESDILSSCVVVCPDTGDMMVLGGSLISNRVLMVTLNVNGT